jgi:hypothetical protein
VKRAIAIWLILFTVGKLIAQDRVWYNGVLVLQTQQVLTGAIAIEPEHDIALHQDAGQVNIYPAHRIRSIQFFEINANINRKYISLQHGTWRRYHLYEVVVKGSVHVLRRQKQRTSSTLSDADSFIYYIYTGSELVHLHAFRKQVYPVLQKEGGVQFSMFVLEQNLNPNDAVHAIRMVQYYNTLMLCNESVARSVDRVRSK